MKLKSGLVLVQEILPDLPPAEKKAGQYILDNPGKILELNITQIASVNKVVAKILSSNKIDIYGIGASGIVALDFY